MDNWQQIIESKFNSAICQQQTVSGGCIANSKIITLENRKQLFVKTITNNNSQIFIQESEGLRELAKAKSIEVAKPILATENCLVLEVVQQGKQNKKTMQNFGMNLARMHKFTSKYFGFRTDNYIGSNKQKNTPMLKIDNHTWSEFFFEYRLFPQFKMAENKKLITDDFRKLFSKLEKNISSILAGQDKIASLLHGDLWGGNFIINSSGNAVLIDPAVYYGNRETDLAMTKLFSGFSADFYHAYNQEYPLETGYKKREKIYNLYHLLNHLNIFGFSYYQQCLNMLYM